MKTPTLVALIVSLLSAGCETPSSKPSSMPGEDGITAADVMDAGLPPDSEKRQEPIYRKSAPSDVKYATGTIWARVFVGQGLSSATLELLSTRLTEKVAADGTRSVTYDVLARLMVDSKPHPLHASGTRTATGSGSAIRQAVEAAVVDVAQQAKVIERRAHPSFVPEEIGTGG